MGSMNTLRAAVAGRAGEVTNARSPMSRSAQMERHMRRQQRRRMMDNMGLWGSVEKFDNGVFKMHECKRPACEEYAFPGHDYCVPECMGKHERKRMREKAATEARKQSSASMKLAKRTRRMNEEASRLARLAVQLPPQDSVGDYEGRCNMCGQIGSERGIQMEIYYCRGQCRQYSLRHLRALTREECASWGDIGAKNNAENVAKRCRAIHHYATNT